MIAVLARLTEEAIFHIRNSPCGSLRIIVRRETPSGTCSLPDKHPYRRYSRCITTRHHHAVTHPIDIQRFRYHASCGPLTAASTPTPVRNWRRDQVRLLLKQRNRRRVKVRIGALILWQSTQILIRPLSLNVCIVSAVDAGNGSWRTPLWLRGHRGPERFLQLFRQMTGHTDAVLSPTLYIGSLKRITSFTPSRCAVMAGRDSWCR